MPAPFKIVSGALLASWASASERGMHAHDAGPRVDLDLRHLHAALRAMERIARVVVGALAAHFDRVRADQLARIGPRELLVGGADLGRRRT